MRVVCVDDERLSLQFIEKQLEQIEGISIVAMFTNPLEAKEYILNEAIDTAFLDVQMPGINGIQLAEQILEYKPDINIVFITAYDQYAVEAFQLNALDYVIKPTTVERLHKTLKRVKAKLKNTANDKDSNQEDHSLRIKVSNYLAFEEKPNVFQPVSWRTSKSQELFIYLLHNRNRLVEKSAIVDLLWYDHDVEKAYALLYTTVYNTRKQLKKYRPNIKLYNRSDGYLLELQNVEIDLVQWENELLQLSKVNEMTIAEYERIMAWNEGPLLANTDYIWLEAERHRLDRLWIHMATKIATYYKEHNQLSEAIKWFQRIIDRLPTLEEAHFNLMELYEKNGEFTLMMQQYDELNKQLRKNLEGKPSSYIIDWYVSKMK